MKGEIDTHLFLEIVQSEGVTFLYGEEIDGDRIEYYHGITGKRVEIVLADELISERAAKALLKQLGLEDLVDRLFYV